MPKNLQNGSHHHHAHTSAHQHGHAHAHDRGWTGFFRYASMLPRMWTSNVSKAVVDIVAPQKEECVVEIGAGMGAAAFVAARSGAKVIAVDPTGYMRRILRLRRLGHLGRRQIEIRAGAAESIPVSDGSADAIWSVNTMHHWSDLNGALAEIHRVLRKGGRLLLVDEAFDDPTHPEHEQFHKRRAGHDHGFIEVDPTKLAAQLQSLGFQAVEGSLEKIAGHPAKVVRGVKK